MGAFLHHRRTVRAGKLLLALLLMNEIRGLCVVIGVLYAWRPWAGW